MDLLFDLGTIVVVATVVAIVAHWLKQPLILAYLATGLLLTGSGIIVDGETVDALAKVGVVFLLFLVGMELDWRKLTHTGPRALVAGGLQVIVTAGLGFWLAQWLGFTLLPALYLAIGVTFASTIHIVATLDRTRELDTLHGRLVLGVLLVQDLVAIVLLIVLARVPNGISGINDIASIVASVGLNGGLLLALTWLAGAKLLPPLFASFRSDHEIPILVAIGWAFLFTGLSSFLGLSIEIGALLAGISLAPLPQSLQLRLKIRPIRDFFMLIFFVSLGLKLTVATVSASATSVVALTLFVVIAHPVILYVIFGGLGYRPRTAFLAALPTTQLSEFSLIIAGLGVTLGQFSAVDSSLLVAIAVLTFVVSTYLQRHSHGLYQLVRPLLTWPSTSGAQAANRDSPFGELTDHSILVGARHLGHAILQATRRSQTPVVVLDLDPAVVTALTGDRVLALLGDATEDEVLELVRADRAAQLISTVGEVDANEQLVRLARSMNRRLRIVVVARTADDALRLYQAGADYVAITHHISGDVLVRFLRELDEHPNRLRQIRSSHIEELQSDRLDFRLAHHHVGDRHS